MDNFQKNAGAVDCPSEVRDSPFDYQENVRAFVAEDTPDIQSRGKKNQLIDYLTENIEYFTTNIEGGTLVLFTSYNDLYRVADKIGPTLEKLAVHSMYKDENYHEWKCCEVLQKRETEYFWHRYFLDGRRRSRAGFVSGHSDKTPIREPYSSYSSGSTGVASSTRT